jgi:NAD+ diphosphatase
MSRGLLFIFDRSPEGSVLLPRCETRTLGFDEFEKYGHLLESHGLVSRALGRHDGWGIIAPGESVPDDLEPVSRRDLAELLGSDVFVRSGEAFQIMSLYINNIFCGKCGARMRDHEKDLARECPECGRLIFPSLCPAVIVAVEKDGMLLMGHNVNFPSGRYSVLAGFVEPGETLEQTVAREVYEESKVRIKNIRYFGSQSWPFPASMMLGFLADWESGEPEPDGDEVSDVRWFTPDDLPDLPPNISISKMLIDDWLRRRAAM